MAKNAESGGRELEQRRIDYTKTLEFLANSIMAPGIEVFLTPNEFEMLKDHLLRIEALGESTEFRLIKCVSGDPQSYLVWRCDENDAEANQVTEIMQSLATALKLQCN